MANSGIMVWLLAARPRTLAASVSPVILGCAISIFDSVFRPIPALLCLLVAVFAQIASNFANDYFDFKKGVDSKNRKGPDRAVTSGWVTPNAMLIATMTMLGLVLLCGVGIVYYSKPWLIFVGIAIAVFVFAYSAGPFPLAYNGLGDICVLIFYGIVPVCFTYYVLTGVFSLLALILSISLGLLSVNILVVNNYRDYNEDKSNNKRTTIVMFGKKFGKMLYLANGTLATVIAVLALQPKPVWIIIFYAVFAFIFGYTYSELNIYDGKALNAVLGHTSRNVLIFTMILVITMFLLTQ